MNDGRTNVETGLWSLTTSVSQGRLWAVEKDRNQWGNRTMDHTVFFGWVKKRSDAPRQRFSMLCKVIFAAWDGLARTWELTGMSYSVAALRTTEIGIRMARGQRRPEYYE